MLLLFLLENRLYNWMSANKLMLNQDNTELLVLHARHRSQPPLEFILVCSNVIHSSNSAKNIGAWFDTVMYMDKQINSNIAQISKRTAGTAPLPS